MRLTERVRRELMECFRAATLADRATVARHAPQMERAADGVEVEDVEDGEQRGRAVALIIMGHGAAFVGLHWQAGLGAVERLDLRFLVDRDGRLVPL